MSSTLQLNESTLTVDANENEIALSWTLEKLTFPGIKFDEILLSVSANGTLSSNGSGSISMNLSSVSIPISAGWQKGLGTGEMICDMSLSGTLILSTSNQKTTVNLSKLTANVMGFSITPLDLKFEITIEDIDDLSATIKNQIKVNSGSLFNQFWSKQIKSPKNSATETVELIFDSLALPVSNPLIAVKGYSQLTTENSTVNGTFNCKWDSKGFVMALNAHVDVLDSKTAVSGTSKTVTDLKSIPTWIKKQVSPLYNKYTHAWLQSIGSYLKRHKLDMAKLFKDNNYLAQDAIIAIDHARMAGPALDAKLLKAGGYSQKDIAISLKKGLNQSPSEFIGALKGGLQIEGKNAINLLFTADYDSKTIGNYLRKLHYNDTYIVTLFKDNGMKAEEALNAIAVDQSKSVSAALTLHNAKYTVTEMVTSIAKYFKKKLNNNDVLKLIYLSGYTPSDVGGFLRYKLKYNEAQIALFYREQGDNGINALSAVNDAYGNGSIKIARAMSDAGYSGAEIANAFRGAFSHDAGQPGSIHNIGETLKNLGYGKDDLSGLSGALIGDLKNYLPDSKKGSACSISLPKIKRLDNL